jgi:quercetin dioxygenase-like cupin family protein
VHKHPYPRSIHVLEGTLTLTAEGGHPHSYPVGSFVVEAVDVWHTGSNIGTTPTTILMIDEVPTAQV